MLGLKEGAGLDMAFRRGWLSGKHYARSLHEPANTRSKPRNPYWCFIRAITWKIGYGLGTWDVLSGEYDE